jgi:hypothetical protein
LSEDLNEKTFYLKIGKWMGETNQSVKDIAEVSKGYKKDLKEHVEKEDADRLEIKTLLAKAIVCPYTETIAVMEEDVLDCCKSVAGIKAERKWIYGGLAIAYAGLLAVCKKLWS